MSFYNKSIKKIIFSYYFILLIILPILFLTIGVFLTINNQKKRIKIIEESSLNFEKRLAKKQVDDVFDFIIYEKEKTKNLSEEKTKKEILKFVEKIKYDKNGYIFINKFNGDALIYDGKILKTHKNIYNKTDKNGINVFKLELEAAKNPNGDFIEYFFKKTGNDEIQYKKISYIKAIPEWEWIIGAGVYKSDISGKILEQKNITYKIIRNEIYCTIIGFIIFFIISYIITILLSKKIKKELNIFNSFFRKASHENNTINNNTIKIKELKELANYANDMVFERNIISGKITHINSILKNIQNLHKLIIEVKDKKIFAQEVCNNLIKSGGYKSIWLALLDKNKQFEFLADAGLNNNGDLLLNNFKKNNFNKCFDKALKSPNLVLIKDVQKECKGCPLLGKEPENRTYTIKLEYSGVIYGILSVSVPEIYFDDIEEQNLFKKLASDLSFLLYNLEIENKNKEAELALIASEKKHRTLFEKVSNVAIFSYNKDFEIIFWNKASEDIFGYSKKEAIGKKTYNLIFPVIKKTEYLNNINIFLKEGKCPDSNEREFKQKNGDLVSIILNSFKSINSNGEYEIFGFCVDITERKKYEEALKQSELELRETNTTKDKFFSIIGHDIRSPFNSIIGFADIIRNNIQKLDSEQIEKIGESIYNTGNKTLDLINNLIEWSRTQTGRIQCNPEKFHLKTIIEENSSFLISDAENKKIKIEIEVNEEIKAFADIRMLETILRNLISNAIKFSFQNGIIKIKAEENCKNILVSIEDNGVGIKKENLDKLFNNNIIHTTIGTNNEKGTGLGLILCKELVEMNNGKIWAESELGKASKFIFTLPLG